jgi:hypothetical protein
MQQTAAKALVRRFFYEEFLPTQLPPQLLQSSNYLVLLGEGPDEMRMLDSLGVPGYRIYSVERDPAVFRRQSQLARRGQLGVVLYSGDLAEFVTHHLHTNQRFRVLNLDIYGAYRTSIDPVMTPILMFARDNQRTVIATYSNAGRDRPQLMEGLKSLAVCRWLAPAATARVVDELFGRYRAAGLSPNVSLNMILRHLFWVRSHLEHTLEGALALHLARHDSVAKLLNGFDRCWNALKFMTAPLRYGQWLEAADRLPRFNSQAKLFDLGLHAVTVATYESTHGMYHTGWFATYQRAAPVSVRDWLEQALTALTASPLRYASGGDAALGSFSAVAETVSPEQVIWSRGKLDLPGRGHSLRFGPAPAKPAKPPVYAVPEPRPLTDEQAALLRDAARSDRSATTAQLAAKLGLQDYPATSLVAYVANARRLA